jgi:vacuolar-type H+-ATPase subunit I/STV1
MKKLTVFAFRKDSDAIIRRLMNLRCVEIRQTEPDREAVALRQTETERRLTELDAKFNRIGEALPILAKYATRKHGIARRVLRVNREEFAGDGRAEKAMETVERTLAVKAELDGSVASQTQMRERMEALLPWQDLDLSFSDLSTRKTVTVPGAFPIGVKQDALEETLSENAIEPEFVSADKTSYYYALTYLRAEEPTVMQLLASYDFLRADLPTTGGTARGELDALQDRLQKSEELFLQTEEKLRDLAEIKDDA